MLYKKLFVAVCTYRYLFTAQKRWLITLICIIWFVLSTPADNEYFDGGPNLFPVASKGGSSNNTNKHSPKVSEAFLFTVPTNLHKEYWLFSRLSLVWRDGDTFYK